MSNKDLLETLDRNGFVASDFNSCNAWGFGGGVGTCYRKGGCEVRVFNAYYRHAPMEKVVTLTFVERAPVTRAIGRVLDELQGPKVNDRIVRGLTRDGLIS